jgi:hypothetical protein
MGPLCRALINFLTSFQEHWEAFQKDSDQRALSAGYSEREGKGERGEKRKRERERKCVPLFIERTRKYMTKLRIIQDHK